MPTILILPILNLIRRMGWDERSATNMMTVVLQVNIRTVCTDACNEILSTS
jgi:hypothetical protein